MQTLYEQLEELLNRLCNLINQPNLRSIFEKKEEQVKISLILPLLGALGWDIHNPLEVLFESPTQEGGRMDIVLKDENKPKFLIEVKNLSQDLARHIDQLGRYIYSQGIPYGAITNGKVWIFMEAFTPGKPFNERKLIEIDICEDEPLTVVPVFSCLSKENISNFKECLKEKIQKIKNHLRRIKENGFKPGRCPTRDSLENYICKKVLEKIEECLSELEKSIKVSKQLEPLEVFQQSTPAVNTDRVSPVVDKYVVILGGERIEASSRPRLIKKILEKALREGWIKKEDFPLTTGRSILASLEPLELKTGIRKWNIQGLTVYFNLGNSGQIQQKRIQELVEFLSKRAPGKFEIVKI